MTDQTIELKAKIYDLTDALEQARTVRAEYEAVLGQIIQITGVKAESTGDYKLENIVEKVKELALTATVNDESEPEVEVDVEE